MTLVSLEQATFDPQSNALPTEPLRSLRPLLKYDVVPAMAPFCRWKEIQEPPNGYRESTVSSLSYPVGLYTARVLSYAICELYFSECYNRHSELIAKYNIC